MRIVMATVTLFLCISLFATNGHAQDNQQPIQSEEWNIAEESEKIVERHKQLQQHRKKIRSDLYEIGKHTDSSESKKIIANFLILNEIHYSMIVAHVQFLMELETEMMRRNGERMQHLEEKVIDLTLDFEGLPNASPKRQ